MNTCLLIKRHCNEFWLFWNSCEFFRDNGSLRYLFKCRKTFGFPVCTEAAVIGGLMTFPEKG